MLVVRGMCVMKTGKGEAVCRALTWHTSALLATYTLRLSLCKIIAVAPLSAFQEELC